MLKRVDHIFDTVFSDKSQKSFEKYILLLATGGFIIHLILKKWDGKWMLS